MARLHAAGQLGDAELFALEDAAADFLELRASVAPGAPQAGGGDCFSFFPPLGHLLTSFHTILTVQFEATYMYRLHYMCCFDPPDPPGPPPPWRP